MNTKQITVTFAVILLTVLCASAFVSVPTITDGIGFQYQNITIGDDRIQICNTNITKEATFVVAASNSLHKEGADFICDGLDDQATIQAAISATGAGELYFAAGTYDFSGYIETTSDGLTISGSGAIFFLHASTNGQLIQIKHNDITIKDIALDGNGANQISGNGLIEVTANSGNLTINHVHFKNAWNAGLYSGGSIGNNRLDGLMMSYCIAEDFYNGISHGGGMAYISWANNIQIDHCVIDNFRHNANMADGVKVVHATNVQISHLLISNVRGHGVFVGFGSEDVQISDIIFLSDVGLSLESVCVEYTADGALNGVGRNKRVSISNVLHYSTAGGNHGIYLEATDDIIVSNCVVEVVTTALDNPIYSLRYINGGKLVNCVSRGLFGSDSSGFNIYNCDDVSLINCDAVDSPVWVWANVPRGGIDVESSENTLISQCTFRDLPAYGILARSSDVKIAGCIFENMGLADEWVAYSIFIAEDRNNVEIRDNTFRLGTGGLTRGTRLYSNNDDCLILNNVYDAALVVLHSVGAGSDNLTMRNNIGYITENSGTATLVSGTTVKTITHGLAVTPSAGDIMVTPMESLGSASFFWIDGYTSTTFNVTANANPAQDVDFAWNAIVL